MKSVLISRQSTPPPSPTAQLDADGFFADLDVKLRDHPAFNHRFLKRIAVDRLDRRQLKTYFSQHYLFGRRFLRNLAAVVANVPDEAARTLLVVNMYEEVGEPLRLRDTLHHALLSAGLITSRDLAAAYEDMAGKQGDVVAWLIEKKIVTREQVAAITSHSSAELKELTHPALFRRFLRAAGFTAEELADLKPYPETDLFNIEFSEVCRNGHWLEGMGAIGPATESLVPVLYSALLAGIRKSELVPPDDCIFWVMHVECDDGHGRNIVEAIKRYARDVEGQRLITEGAVRVLDARVRWFDGLYGRVFGA